MRIDCRGVLCPVPVIELAKRMAGVPVGAVVEVLADDPAAAHDIPAWCRMRGHQLEETAEEGGVPLYRVRRVR